MDSKVVLITGGSSGIGKAIGLYLVKKGLKVYGTARNPSSYPDHNEFRLLPLEVTKPESITAVISEIIEIENRIDVLINNAGVGITGPIEETPDEEITKAFNVNFNGPLRMIKAVLPQMRMQKEGLIINITSIAGHMGLPFRGIYSSTKGALALATEAIRMETKDFGIQITNIAPGDFATNIASGRYHAPIKDDSPYKETYGKTLSSINADVDAGENPIKVAEKVYDVISSKRPKVNYAVGETMQRLSLLLKRILPDKIYEKILLNHYKL